MFWDIPLDPEINWRIEKPSKGGRQCVRRFKGTRAARYFNPMDRGEGRSDGGYGDEEPEVELHNQL